MKIFSFTINRAIKRNVEEGESTKVNIYIK